MLYRLAVEAGRAVVHGAMPPRPILLDREPQRLARWAADLAVMLRAAGIPAFAPLGPVLRPVADEPAAAMVRAVQRGYTTALPPGLTDQPGAQLYELAWGGLTAVATVAGNWTILHACMPAMFGVAAGVQPCIVAKRDDMLGAGVKKGTTSKPTKAMPIKTMPIPVRVPAAGSFERLLGDRLGQVEDVSTASEPMNSSAMTIKPAAELVALRAADRRETVPSRRGPITVAACLLFARAVDRVPGLVEALRRATPRVVIEVADPLVLTALRGIWPLALFGEGVSVEAVASTLSPQDAGLANILTLLVVEPMKPKEKEALDRAFLQLFQVARPMLCLSPDPDALLPASALRAADHRLVLPALDAATTHVVTGRPSRAARIAELGTLSPTLADLAIAIRSDRTPADCVARLRDLSGLEPVRSGGGRDLGLGQLQGMDAAVAWARSTLDDVAARRRGALPWASIDAGLLLLGPPGTSKTLLPAVMAAEGGMGFVTGSLATWQSQDQAHLGTTLRAMRLAFEKARTMPTGPGRPGCILLIDEIDSFPDRSRVVHDHRDYVVECVNAMLELLSGATARVSVIVIGTTNDATRLDPALLRPGRLGRTLAIG